MKNLSIFKLLVGDIIQINTGDKIPADCILYSGNAILSDESNMTGETAHLKKEGIDQIDEPTPTTDVFLIGGATIVQGTGVAIVCAVGKKSRQGLAEAALNTTEDRMTPLQAKLAVIGD